MMKKFFLIFSVLLLVYMIWPGPTKIADFKPLPSSNKSTLAGDNIEQVSNVAGYFSDNFRPFVTSFYKSNYWQKTLLPFPPIELIHPPEYAFVTIKKHTDSTYLEELVYPLRDSLYVNGFEPFYSDGSPKFWGSTKFDVDGGSFYTKTTLRFYPSPIYVRILVWLGIVVSVYGLSKVGKKILFNI
ncbi:MAG: hypothetical protein PHV63_00955 [Candidatus Daviesbacteria bacterium]|nr:hypothetical protein [Candidatus Daviesbacteria bacterium]